jgi:hypothetical protein
VVWVGALALAGVGARAPALFSPPSPGFIYWSTGDRSAALWRVGFTPHNGRDMGLGRALAPRARGVAQRLFRARGYDVRVRPSDWVLGPSDAPLAGALVEGWAGAATEQRPEHAARVRAWAARRGGGGGHAEITLRVGHQDVLALPPDA